MKSYIGPETQKAISNFPISGEVVSLKLIHSLATIKICSAKANSEIGKLDKHKALAISDTCREIEEGKLDSQFPTDSIQGGAGTSINMNINEVVAARVNEIAGKNLVHYIDDVNMSQSTNDTLPTALRLSLLRDLDSYADKLKLLHKAFTAKHKEFENIKKPGRTHLQEAVEITLGDEFGAYASFVKRDINRLKEAQKHLLETNLGGTAIGTKVNTSDKYISSVHKFLQKETGYKLVPSENLIDSTQNLDVFLHIGSVLNTSATALSKIVNDLRLMASGPNAGIGEIILPVYQRGSTIMPGKVNPVTLEAYNQIAFKVSGNTITLSQAVQAGQFELNVMFPVIAQTLLESSEMLVRGAEMLTKTVIKIRANHKNCMENFSKSILKSANLSEKIGYDSAEKKIIAK